LRIDLDLVDTKKRCNRPATGNGLAHQAEVSILPPVLRRSGRARRAMWFVDGADRWRAATISENCSGGSER
jgi:hypothetical protein